MNFKYILYATLAVSCAASATNNIRVGDIRSLALGGSGAAVTWFVNPSLMELSTKRTTGVDYFNRYGIKELGTVQGYFVYPNTFLSAGLQVASFGYDQYRQNMGRILLSKRLNKHWSVGVAFQYDWIHSELYEVVPSRISTDIGIVYKPIENLLMAFTVCNLPSIQTTAKTFKINELETYRIEVGFNWQVLNNVWITSYGAVDEAHDIISGIGAEYRAFSAVCFRMGVQTEPFLPCIGVGFFLKGFDFNTVAVWHPELGISTGLGLSYSF